MTHFYLFVGNVRIGELNFGTNQVFVHLETKQGRFLKWLDSEADALAAVRAHLPEGTPLTVLSLDEFMQELDKIPESA